MYTMNAAASDSPNAVDIPIMAPREIESPLFSVSLDSRSMVLSSVVGLWLGNEDLIDG